MLKISSPSEAASLVDAAQALGLRTASTASFPSMARAPDERGGSTRLVAVKAVTDGYRCAVGCRCATGPTGR